MRRPASHVGAGNPAARKLPRVARVHRRESECCQIDLLLRTKGALYVFEIKFRATIGFTVIEDVKKKVARAFLPAKLCRRGSGSSHVRTAERTQNWGCCRLAAV